MKGDDGGDLMLFDSNLDNHQRQHISSTPLKDRSHSARIVGGGGNADDQEEESDSGQNF